MSPQEKVRQVHAAVAEELFAAGQVTASQIVANPTTTVANRRNSDKLLAARCLRAAAANLPAEDISVKEILLQQAESWEKEVASDRSEQADARSSMLAFTVQAMLSKLGQEISAQLAAGGERLAAQIAAGESFCSGDLDAIRNAQRLAASRLLAAAVALPNQVVIFHPAFRPEAQDPSIGYQAPRLVKEALISRVQGLLKMAAPDPEEG